MRAGRSRARRARSEREPIGARVEHRLARTSATAHAASAANCVIDSAAYGQTVRSPSEYHFRGATSDDDLRQILSLQAANLPDALTAEEARAQGFVSLRHDLALLSEMNAPWPHIVATPEGRGEVVAYALVMLHELRDRFPLLAPMYEQMEDIEYEGRPLGEYRSYVMGQVCVARAHRGRGLVEGLYAAHRAQMAPHFDLMITEISRANGRSLRAHERAGFAVLREYRSSAGQEWVVVGLDLRRGAG